MGYVEANTGFDAQETALLGVLERVGNTFLLAASTQFWMIPPMAETRLGAFFWFAGFLPQPEQVICRARFDGRLVKGEPPE